MHRIARAIASKISWNVVSRPIENSNALRSFSMRLSGQFLPFSSLPFLNFPAGVWVTSFDDPSEENRRERYRSIHKRRAPTGEVRTIWIQLVVHDRGSVAAVNVVRWVFSLSNRTLKPGRGQVRLNSYRYTSTGFLNTWLAPKCGLRKHSLTPIKSTLPY